MRNGRGGKLMTALSVKFGVATCDRPVLNNKSV